MTESSASIDRDEPAGELLPGFEAVIGQGSAVRALRSATAARRLPHAMIFSGPEGVGKATCALIVAAALNCPRRGPDDACGDCRSCGKIGRGLHPDVVTVRPDGRVIKTEQVREIGRQVAYRPYEGTCRVVIVDDAQAMSPAAQNAILKTLEEPPPSSVLILVTSAPGGLLPTVRSRCTQLRFGPLPLPAVQRFLREARGLPASEARLRARLAPGSLGKAVSLDLEAYSLTLDTAVEAIRLAQEGGAGVVAAAASLADAGTGGTAAQRAASALEVARGVVRDLLVLAAGADTELLVHVDRLGQWRDWSRSIEPQALAAGAHAIEAGIERLTRGIQPNVKMSLEHTLLQLSSVLGDSKGAR